MRGGQILATALCLAVGFQASVGQSPDGHGRSDQDEVGGRGWPSAWNSVFNPTGAGYPFGNPYWLSSFIPWGAPGAALAGGNGLAAQRNVRSLDLVDELVEEKIEKVQQKGKGKIKEEKKEDVRPVAKVQVPEEPEPCPPPKDERCQEEVIVLQVPAESECGPRHPSHHRGQFGRWRFK